MTLLGIDQTDNRQIQIQKDSSIKKNPIKTNVKDQTLKDIDGLFR